MTKKLKIAFQGEPGANSHIAIVEAYPDAEPLPCATFEDALSAISSGEADLGMIPIENSVAGRVADIHHLLPASGLFIVGEWFLPIRHQLMAVRGDKARRHQDGGEPRPRARPVPAHHPQARHQADRRGRHRRQRARRFRARRQDASPRSPRGWRRKSTASISSPRMSRTRPTTPRASWCWRARRTGPSRARAAGHDFCFPRAQPAGRALQGARRLRHQRRQHDQAGKLHGRRRISSPRSSMPTSTAIPRTRASPLRWRN